MTPMMPTPYAVTPAYSMPPSGFPPMSHMTPMMPPPPTPHMQTQTPRYGVQVSPAYNIPPAGYAAAVRVVHSFLLYLLGKRLN